jgi:hypothetical protein
MPSQGRHEGDWSPPPGEPYELMNRFRKREVLVSLEGPSASPKTPSGRAGRRRGRDSARIIVAAARGDRGRQRDKRWG